MTETSEDKTKRKYVDRLLAGIWTHQYSVFYKDIDDSIHLIEDAAKFRQGLGRKFPDQPFLIRLALKAEGRTTQAWLSVLTTQKTPELIEWAERKFSKPVNVIKRPYSQAKAEKSAGSIRKHKPHDLNYFFGKEKVNRYGLINEERYKEMRAAVAEVE
ncbi:hypothetical protein ID144_14680 [Pseudomonas sp. JM0905a]|uniref:hypothetical protein n=1 Tax=Pseudomonas sp. JM0905a TaxID=2772484 RepID=UPI0016877314|nr:hypothetical protein [Pseudomonas sp. JM0905a]MBD2838291.1 hypothetical protein [Pseudomonas sp. JM0905a]